MKKILIAIICLLLTCILFSQDNLKLYQELYQQGESLYKKEDYKNAAIAYSSLLRLQGIKLSVSDWDRAAFSWALAGNHDSAFYFLNVIADMDTLTFAECDDVINDGDYNVLVNDKRWSEIKDRMFLNLYKKYSPDLIFTKRSKAPKKILIDGAHFNGHNIDGTYTVMAGTLNYCGFNVSGINEKFTIQYLKDANILIISNPLSDVFDSLVKRAKRDKEEFRWSAAATKSAYTEKEIAIVEDWVNKGGSLLLILDHAPYGKTGGTLAAAFGVECRNVGTYDSLSRDLSQPYTPNLKTIIFTRSNGLIGKHPILYGVDSVTTYTGESLMGPAKSEPLLILSSTATDLDWIPETREFRNRPSFGRSQGVAFEYGRGRVVVFGEAAMINAESISYNNRGNLKFLLNTIKWLAREKID